MSGAPRYLRIAAGLALAGGAAAWAIAVRPGLYEGAERTDTLTAIEPYGGQRCWRAPLPAVALASASLEVLEDGRPLGPAVDPVVDWRRIHEVGEGAWGRSEIEGEDEHVLFSSSDGTAPVRNGRVYAVRYVPRPIDRRSVVWIAIFLGAAAALLARAGSLAALPGADRAAALDRAARAAAHPAVLAAVVLLPALLARTPYVGIANLEDDSHDYLALAGEVAAGRSPAFTFRSAGYPLFLAAILSAGGDLGTVAAVQSALTLAAGLFLVACVRRTSRAAALPAAIAVAAFLASPSPPFYESSILTEALYVAVLLVAIGALLAAVQDGSAGWAFLASAALGAAIVVRTAGIYLVVLHVLTVAHLVRAGAGRRRVLAFLLPLPALLLAAAAWNAAAGAGFRLSATSQGRIGPAATFLAEDEAFPPEVNAEIRRSRDALSRRDREVLETSWDPDELWPIYVGFTPALYASGLPETKARGLTGEVAERSIRARRDLYAKFVWTNVHRSFTSYTANAHFPPGYRLERRQRLLDDLRGREAFARTGTPLPGPDAPFGRATGPIDSAYRFLVHGHRILAKSGLWAILFGLSFLTALGLLARSGGRDPRTFQLFALGSVAIGGALVTSFVTLAIERYVYPWEVAFYLSPVLAPGAVRAWLGRTR